MAELTISSIQLDLNSYKVYDPTTAAEAMRTARANVYTVTGVTDYAAGAEMPRVSGLQKEAAQTLPTTNVIEYRHEGNNKVIFRPSGTEPKVKAYVFAKGETRAEAQELLDTLRSAAEEILS